MDELVEIFLRKKRGAVNALQLGIFFVAQPVGASDIQQLERFDFSSRRDVRAAAEIGELTRAINRNFFIGLGELLDEVALHEIAFVLEFVQSLIAGQKFARVRNVLLHQLLHLLFDFFQVLWRKRRGPIEIVEKSALGWRAVAELGLGEEFEHGGRQQVRRRMPKNFQGLGIFLSQDAQSGVFFHRTSQIDEIAVGLGNQRGVGEPLADGFGDIERSAALGDFLHAPVGKLDMNVSAMGKDQV